MTERVWNAVFAVCAAAMAWLVGWAVAEGWRASHPTPESVAERMAKSEAAAGARCDACLAFCHARKLKMLRADGRMGCECTEVGVVLPAALDAKGNEQ